jgi:hypothetical protein
LRNAAEMFSFDPNRRVQKMPGPLLLVYFMPVTQDDYELKKANHVFGWWGGGGGAGGEPACLGWPRIKISLLVWNFFQNHKIIEISLFYEAETGFMENIAS